MMTQENVSINECKADVTKLSLGLKLFVAAMQVVERVAPAVVTNLMLTKFLTPRRKKEAAYESRLPAGARPITVNHRGQQLAGWRWQNDGPTILVVHGWESHTGRMLPLIRPLLAQGYQVTALDLPGHGLSPAAETHLLDASEAIQAALVEHGPFAGVIAHSYGAAATAVALSRVPHLAPEKVVLLSPMRDLEQHVEIFAAIAQLSPAAVERLKRQIAQRVGMPLGDCSAIKAVSRLPRPGLVIHDRDDLLIPYAVGQAVARGWAGAQFVGTDRLGHRRGLGHRLVLQSLFDFLAAESATAPQPLAARRAARRPITPPMPQAARQLTWATGA
jgi:pimeloyl-ACP methyl ester carboxylesterase